MKKHYLIIFFFSFNFVYKPIILAQSPTDLTSNVDLTTCTNCTNFAPHGFFSNTTQIVNAFNFARRAEETQLSLSANTLGDLTLPGNYSTLSPNNRALFILNAERTARAGKVYGGNTVLGLPLEALENNLSNLALGHTNDMITNNIWSHTGSNNASPYDRINNSSTYGPSGNCRDFMSYAENLYVACSGSTSNPTYLVEQAVFAWIYRDAGSAWGHRRACLIQNSDSYGAVGFTNNVGSGTSEGFLGIGIGTRVHNGTSYPACGGTFNAHLVTMKIADPKPSCVANYALPVELTHFIGEIKNSVIKLKWSTASEYNNKKFIVEKSKDAKRFYEFMSLDGAGTTSESNFYTVDDYNPYEGVNYYRLVQIDLDGRESVSNIITIQNQNEFGISVYPNPTNESIYIGNSFSESTEVEVVNNLGEIVKRITIIEKNQNIDVSYLPAGLYIIRTARGYSSKFIKMK